jgi:uncharacterized protein GlcG (DUF336 family)
MYVMNTKLTLRMDEALIHVAKKEAGRRGKSVSKMVGDFLGSLSATTRQPAALPPITTSLLGVLKPHSASVESYKKHLKEKYL